MALQDKKKAEYDQISIILFKTVNPIKAINLHSFRPTFNRKQSFKKDESDGNICHVLVTFGAV